MPTYTAFLHEMWLATGSRAEIVAALHAVPETPRASDLLVFDDATGRQVDFDMRDAGEEQEVPAPRPRGRPSLGVVAREVTLLPRHWDWLAAQPEGASAALRRLVEGARKRDGGARAGKDAAFRFMTAIAGDRVNFEEATRALYAGDRERMAALMADWPVGIRNHALSLADGAGAIDG